MRAAARGPVHSKVPHTWCCRRFATGARSCLAGDVAQDPVPRGLPRLALFLSGGILHLAAVGDFGAFTLFLSIEPCGHCSCRRGAFSDMLRGGTSYEMLRGGASCNAPERNHSPLSWSSKAVPVSFSRSLSISVCVCSMASPSVKGEQLVKRVPRSRGIESRIIHEACVILQFIAQCIASHCLSDASAPTMGAKTSHGSKKSRRKDMSRAQKCERNEKRRGTRSAKTKA